MDINISSLFLLVLLLNVYLCNGNHNVLCIESERRALLQFKHHLLDPSNRLSSWSADADADADCCQWVGVLCNNLTGHVNNLNLRPPPGPWDDGEAFERSMLSGNINPSLLSLKDLRFLDLSNNLFDGIQIPTFLTSMRSLRYLNLSQAGFGGRIPHQLGNLTNLKYLSVRGYGLYVENLQWLSNLSLLQHLDLSYVNLTKASDWLQVMNTLPFLIELHLSDCGLQHIPPLTVANLSSLSILDLSWNYPILIRLVSSLTNVVSLDLSSCYIEGPIPDNLQNMTSLKFLNLKFNKFNSSIPEWLYTLSRIEYLDLGSNQLQGKISNAIGNLTSLKFLNLNFNKFNSSIPEWLYTLSRIEYLSLGFNKLQGKISNAIGNLTSLVRLDLSSNELEVEQGFLSSLENLCNLKSIKLSDVKLKVEISQVLKTLSSGCLSSDDLETLQLDYCQLYGHLTDQIGQFKNLASLVLCGNSISGSIPESLGELSSLRYLYLFNNQEINGTLPRGLGQLKKLETLVIYNTSLEGIVSEVHFSNLTRLKTLLFRSSLSLNVSLDWVPSFQLRELDMRSWHLGPGFPLWLRTQKNLEYLDISDAKILDIIPSWFSNFAPYLYYANLSHNQIRGRIPDLSIFSSLIFRITIDMSSNKFNGPLGHVSSNVSGLDLSNNSLSGSISHFLCNKLNVPHQMQILNLGRNNFSGTIPNCWGKWQKLEAIRLDNNNLSGNIPSSMASLIVLQSLLLRKNRFSGEFPQSLRNCTMLKKVDIGENELVGHIPTWIGEALPNLKIFSLPSNKLGGHIPDGLCALSSLRILDLAHNNFSASIPRCLCNFSAMATKNYSEDPMFRFINGVYEIALLVMKDRVVEYSTTLQLVKSMDLSNNSLSGEIPEEVTCLQELQSLNFSDNMLSGSIPKNIGSMKSLESLDFSINQLSGEIPPSISSLTFLNHLNLSDNNLTGKIPTGTQLQSFDASSFIGNELCGPPLTQNCSASNVVPPTMENGSKKEGRGHEVNWFYVSMALGFIVGFWSVLCPLFLNRAWRFRYYQYMDNIGYKLYDFIVECKCWRS